MRWGCLLYVYPVAHVYSVTLYHIVRVTARSVPPMPRCSSRNLTCASYELARAAATA